MATVALDEGANGSSIEVTRGDLLTVQLPENPSTGFKWHLDLSGEAIVVESSEFTRASDAMGASGQRTFRLRAERVGTVRLDLRNRREWEVEPEAASGVFLVRVVVK
jgi:inhibitor of cysteine peptidase